VVEMSAGQNRRPEARLGPVREETMVMLTATEASQTVETGQDMRARAKTLSWMASLSVAAGEIRAAEGYLLELLAWCAFADRDPDADAPAPGDDDGL